MQVTAASHYLVSSLCNSITIAHFSGKASVVLSAFTSHHHIKTREKVPSTCKGKAVSLRDNAYPLTSCCMLSTLSTVSLVKQTELKGWIKAFVVHRIKVLSTATLRGFQRRYLPLTCPHRNHISLPWLSLWHATLQQNEAAGLNHQNPRTSCC
jgi:hypothetical protein